jgi:uncharacterized protein
MTKDNILKELSATPFVPHPALKNAHGQTIMGALIPRRFRLVVENTETRFFDVAPGVRVLAHCSWQQERASKPTLLIAHGMEGSSESRYMMGTAEKALEAGFSVIRLNHRNCGGTEHLTPTLYHAGLTDDIRQIITELIDKDKLGEIYLVGFSLGGNIALKLAGEYGDAMPEAVRAVVAVSPSIDLASCADAIEMRSNIIYNWNFLLSLRSRLRRKAKLFPEDYDISHLRGVWSIRKFDDVYTAPHAGFLNVAHYYERASALPFISRITTPTLIIHAKDDPFIPFAPFEKPEVASNPNVTLLATEHGGHVGFVSARAEGENRFWAEVMVVEFVSLMSRQKALM